MSEETFAGEVNAAVPVRPGRRRARRSRVEWRWVFEAHAMSGLSGLGFCRREGIAPSVFYRARKRLGLKEGSEALSRVSSVGPPASSLGSPASWADPPASSVGSLVSSADPRASLPDSPAPLVEPGRGPCPERSADSPTSLWAAPGKGFIELRVDEPASVDRSGNPLPGAARSSDPVAGAVRSGNPLPGADRFGNSLAFADCSSNPLADAPALFSGVEIVTGGGTRIALYRGFDDETLGRAMRTLSALNDEAASARSPTDSPPPSRRPASGRIS